MSMEEEVKLEREIVAYRDEHQVGAHAHAHATHAAPATAPILATAFSVLYPGGVP